MVATGSEGEGFAELDHAFSHACRVHGTNLKNIMHLFELLYKQFEDRWSDFIPRIITSYVENDLIHRLGAALVKFIFRLLKSGSEKAKVDRWISNWQEYTGKNMELSFSNGLLNAAWRYAQTGDELFLYNLPSEERKLITDFEKPE